MITETARIQAQMCLIPTRLLFSLCDTISKEKRERIDHLSSNWTTVFLIYFSSSPLICSFHLPRPPFHIAKNMHIRRQEMGEIVPDTDSISETLKSESHSECSLFFQGSHGNLLS